ncbi:MAG: heavy metal-binding domain-containing protein [Thiotrichaceae bacterium]|nr:heavy metal-binding domain-containing protein [Thiotrichaceae bacterium]
MYELFFIFILLIISYFIGTHREKKHYKSLISREKVLNSLPAISVKTPPKDKAYNQQLVIGNVTISVDYFKRFLATLHNFFGGRVTSYETLLDRARREALLRMKEAASLEKASLVVNVKYETVAIYTGRRRAIGSVEILAYGTAMIPLDNEA